MGIEFGKLRQHRGDRAIHGGSGPKLDGGAELGRAQAMTSGLGVGEALPRRFDLGSVGSGDQRTRRQGDGLLENITAPDPGLLSLQPGKGMAEKAIQPCHSAPMHAALNSIEADITLAPSNRIQQQTLRIRTRARSRSTWCGAGRWQGHGDRSQVSFRSSSGRIARNSPRARIASTARQEAVVREP